MMFCPLPLNDTAESGAAGYCFRPGCPFAPAGAGLFKNQFMNPYVLLPLFVPVPGVLSNVATFKRGTVQTNANQTNIQPVYEVYAGVQGRDLGGVSGDIGKIVTELQKQLKPGNSIQIVGQIDSMNGASCTGFAPRPATMCFR